MRVGLRVPDVVVNAVRDASQAVAPLAREPVESVPLLRPLNLVGVAAADGRDGVRGHQARLERRGRAVRQKDVRLLAPAVAEPPEVAGVERPLVGEVVYG